MNADVIQIDNISKRFGRTIALDQVSLQVPRGVVFALLGENGAGKSTLIRILTGFLRPDEGETRVLGKSSIMSSLEIRRQVGYVSDSPAMYEWMTAEEIGWFTSAFYDQGYSLRYTESLREFEIPSGVKLKHMSRGQRAKVGLALSTAHDPELLILDEPTSGLDPIVRRQFLESMVDRAATGHTVFLSSHQIHEVERVADWVAILHQGKLKLVESLESLRSAALVITATLSDAAVMVAPPRGELMSESIHGRQMRWLVRHLESDWRKDFETDPGIQDFQAIPATLEDIFVAVCGNQPSVRRTQSSPDQAHTAPLLSSHES